MKYLPVYFALCLAACLAMPVHATTHHVPDDFATIQAGLNASATGDTVLVQPGTYYENIIWPQRNGIKLIAAGDSSNTIIDGNEEGRVITMDNNGPIDTITTVIQGFKIQNGGIDGYGAGIYCDQSNIAIHECVILRNRAYSSEQYEIPSGGGIFCAYSEAFILECNILDNFASSYFAPGGGVSSHYSTITINYSTIANNVASDGGGIYGYRSKFIIHECLILDNSVYDDYGGGMYCTDSTYTTITNSTITGNSAEQAGGGILSSRLTMDNCVINNNSVQFYSGGIAAGTLSTIRNSIISDNTGSGVDLGSGSVIENCLVSGNHAESGGGIDIHPYSNPIISNCTIEENTAEAGGGIHCSYYSEPLIKNCIIKSNSATSGGGMYIYSFAHPTVSYCEVIGNHISSKGGGIYSNTDSYPTISYSLIKGNTSTPMYAAGGGVYFESGSNPYVTHCTITTNAGNGEPWSGCGIYVKECTSTIRGCIITNNSGSGIYISRDSPYLKILNCNIYGNLEGKFRGNGVDIKLGIIVDSNMNEDPCDAYDNIFLDPLFVDPRSGNYHLLSDSPCIDAGGWGSPRDPDGTLADLGAFYFDQSIDEGEEEEPDLPETLTMLPAYPNPFNESTILRVNLPEAVDLEVTVYNIIGQQVATLANGRYDAGSYPITFNAAHLSGGVYFVKLIANGWSDAQKVVLLR